MKVKSVGCSLSRCGRPEIRSSQGRCPGSVLGAGKGCHGTRTGGESKMGGDSGGPL